MIGDDIRIELEIEKHGRAYLVSPDAPDLRLDVTRCWEHGKSNIGRFSDAVKLAREMAVTLREARRDAATAAPLPPAG